MRVPKIAALAVTAVLASAPPAVVHGVQSSPTAQFKAGTDLIRVDVSVLDRNRRQVTGLTAADFTLTEDGKQQPIAGFSEVAFPESGAGEPQWIREAAPDIRRNTDAADNRLVVILLDDALMPSDPTMVMTAKGIARDVINQLGPRDRAAVVFTQDSRSAQNFTNERARLLAAVDSFKPGFADPSNLLSGEPAVVQMEKARALGLTRTLRLLVDALASIPERRKAVVCISVGAPVDVESNAVGNPQPLDPAIQAYAEVKEITRLALRANVSLYAVDPGGLDGIRLAIERSTRSISYVAEKTRMLEIAETMTRAYHDFNRVISDNTGGHAYLNTNEFKTAVSQIIRETGSFYLLGYTPPNPRADGRFRRIQVKVNKPGLTVTARRGYYAPDPPRAGALPPAPTSTAIAGLLPKSDLSLQGTAVVFPVHGEREASVLLLLGLRAPSVSSPGTDKVSVVMTAFNSEGQQRGSVALNAEAVLNSGGHVKTPSEIDYEVAGRMRLPPGRYELRMAAESGRTGVTGSVYYDLEVPDFSASALAVSGLAVSVDPAVPISPKEAFSSIPVLPTTRRQFSNSDRVNVFVQIYQSGSSQMEAVSMLTEIVDSKGNLLNSATKNLDPMSFNTSRVASEVFAVDVSKLGPGPYLLRLSATRGSTTVTRSLQFTVL